MAASRRAAFGFVVATGFLDSETEQGRLQGVTQMFAISIARPQGSPGFALLMGSVLLAIAMAVALTVRRVPKAA